MRTASSVPRRFCAMLVVVTSAIAARSQAAPPPAVLEAETRRIEAMDKAKNAVLAVFSPDGRGGGSGVVISPDGYALTNFHVVMPCGTAMQCGMADGRVYDAVLVGVDPTGDVALIKLFGREDFPRAEMADSDRLRVGDWVFAMGNPFLLAEDFQPTVTYGIISGVHRYQSPAGTLLEYTDCLQTDASINPGNSGGPLFNADGQLVGINGRASFEKRGRINVGTAYAISINQIKNFLGALRGGRIVDHATLGVQVDFSEDGWVVVTEILEDCDARRRGLAPGDEIIRLGGRAVASPNGFKNILGIFPKGWRVPLSYRRDGKRHDVLVRLSGVHGEEELLKKIGVAREIEPTPAPEKNPKNIGKKGEENKRGGPSPDGEAAGPPAANIPVPEVVRKHFLEKRGFANYYFNLENQRRVWNAWNARQKPGDGVWTLAGPLKGGGQFRFQISDAGASLKLPASEIRWAVGDDLGTSLPPARSGGLLPALYLWRRLAVEGIGRFGDVRYDGASPLPDRTEPADVLVGTHKGVECRFYFDASDGRLLMLEMFPDDNADPCEVYFSEYREQSGRVLPGRIEVRHGDGTFAVLKIGEFKMERRGPDAK